MKEKAKAIRSSLGSLAWHRGRKGRGKGKEMGRGELPMIHTCPTLVVEPKRGVKAKIREKKRVWSRDSHSDRRRGGER